MSYHQEVLPPVRALVLVLAVLVGAGSTLLDSCVLGCHGHAHAAQTPAPGQHTASCHQGTTSSDQPQWQATSTCNHDHGELSADVGAQPRPDAGLKTVSLAVSLRPAGPVSDQQLVMHSVGGAEIDPPSQSSTFLAPLRL